MSNPTRPQSVPSTATVIYPNGVGTPPGWDPQMAAVEQFESTIKHQNFQAGMVYAGAYRDWQANDAQYTALGIQGPPPPTLTLKTANAVWADLSGVVHTTRQGGDYAWIWES